MAQAKTRIWAMKHATSEQRWNASQWRKRCGELREVPFHGQGDPTVLRMFYMPGADMTLLAARGERRAAQRLKHLNA
jgi:hypothetical protein